MFWSLWLLFFFIETFNQSCRWTKFILLDNFTFLRFFNDGIFNLWPGDLIGRSLRPSVCLLVCSLFLIFHKKRFCKSNNIMKVTSQQGDLGIYHCFLYSDCTWLQSGYIQVQSKLEFSTKISLKLLMPEMSCWEFKT